MGKFLIVTGLLFMTTVTWATSQTDQLTQQTASSMQSCITSPSGNTPKPACVQNAIMAGMTAQIQAMWAFYAGSVNQEYSAYQNSLQTPSTFGGGPGQTGLQQRMSPAPIAPQPVSSGATTTPPPAPKQQGIQYY